MKDFQPDRKIDQLWRDRPRDLFSRVSLSFLAAGVAYSWLAGELQVGRIFATGRWENLRRFGREILPYPLQHPPQNRTSVGAESLLEEGHFEALIGWFGQQAGTAVEATWTTLLLSVVAIVAAGLWGAASALASSKKLTDREPFLAPASRGPWWLLRAAARVSALWMRAMPEYVAAFLFVALFGPSPWSVVLALAMHNAGILSRLGAEAVDNLDPRRAEALSALGASRMQMIWAHILPEVSGRWLLYFFYRWETCVREATVLGMLGVASLGYWIQDARARQHLDEMVLLILCGGLLVVLGDGVSTWVRHKLRQSVG